VAAESPTHPRRRHHPETGLALIGPAARPLVPAWLPLTLTAGNSVSPPVRRPGLQTIPFCERVA